MSSYPAPLYCYACESSAAQPMVEGCPFIMGHLIQLYLNFQPYVLSSGLAEKTKMPIASRDFVKTGQTFG